MSEGEGSKDADSPSSKTRSLKRQSSLLEFFAGKAPKRHKQVSTAKASKQLSSEVDGSRSERRSASTHFSKSPPPASSPRKTMTTRRHTAVASSDEASSSASASALQRSRHRKEADIVTEASDTSAAAAQRTPSPPPLWSWPLGDPEPSVVASASHTVLTEVHSLDVSKAPMPIEAEDDLWDSDHVRMPCSRHNKYVVEGKDGEPVTKLRWSIIQHSLLHEFRTSRDIERAIKTYNKRYAKRWSFDGLHKYFNEHIDAVRRKHLLSSTVPAMARLALRLPDLVPAPIPLLRAGCTAALTLSQLQIACLLANAFFCTFPRRNATHRGASTLPSINFCGLYWLHHRRTVLFAKLDFMFNYFERVTTVEPTGVVTFHRQKLTARPDWKTSTQPLRHLTVADSGGIEHAKGMLQADFANKYIGGGTLRTGCVQEEIRFIICPELIASQLFCEVMKSNEAIIMIGAEQYSKYTGYASQTEFAGSYVDNTPRDRWNRRKTMIAAFDAIPFAGYMESQYADDLVLRELNKAYIACRPSEGTDLTKPLAPFATGNWGCGAFGGDLDLKAALQFLAASEAGRDVVYFPFNEVRFGRRLKRFVEALNDAEVPVKSVGELSELVFQWAAEVDQAGGVKKQPLLSALIRHLQPSIEEVFEEDTLQIDSSSASEDEITDSMDAAFSIAAALAEASVEEKQTGVEEEKEEEMTSAPSDAVPRHETDADAVDAQTLPDSATIVGETTGRSLKHSESRDVPAETEGSAGVAHEDTIQSETQCSGTNAGGDRGARAASNGVVDEPGKAGAGPATKKNVATAHEPAQGADA